MIRVNLLANDRRTARKTFSFDILRSSLALVCAVILAVSGLYIGWRFVSLGQNSRAIDRQIADAQQQTAQLRSVITQVQEFEKRKVELQDRVTLIEQLRKDQTGPVHMLDQVSRSLPPMLWLTEMKQGASADEVLIDGRCQTLTGLSDFVASLEHSGFFKKSIEIVSTVSEAAKPPIGELIKFQIKAVFQRPGDAKAASADAKPASAPAQAQEAKPRG